MNIECEFLWEHDLFEGSQEVAVALKAVSICIDSERYDQSKLGRYGKNGYLYQIDQPANPETGEITPINHGTLEPGVPIEWNYKLSISFILYIKYSDRPVRRWNGVRQLRIRCGKERQPPHAIDLEMYDTVILGSSIYIGYVSKKMRTHC